MKMVMPRIDVYILMWIYVWKTYTGRAAGLVGASSVLMSAAGVAAVLGVVAEAVVSVVEA